METESDPSQYTDLPEGRKLLERKFNHIEILTSLNLIYSTWANHIV